MGNRLFGINLSGIILGAFRGKLLSATLHSVEPGTRNPADLSSGTNPTSTDHACEGILDAFRLDQFDGTTVQRGDRKALIIGDSIVPAVAPKTNDRLTIEGRTHQVVRVLERDPAVATYLLHLR